jgi:hypothetical protein
MTDTRVPSIITMYHVIRTMGLTICYSFRLIYFVLCDFNFVPFYSMVETSYKIMFGIIGLLIISIFLVVLLCG